MGALLSTARVHGATFTVNSTLDAPDANVADNVCATAALVCTLRAAIQQANATAGADVIAFSIAGSPPHVISPTSALPDITQPVTVGSTAPGCGGSPTVVINGLSAGPTANGLTLAAGSSPSKVCTLVVQNFSAHGIVVYSNGNTLTRNYIGTNAAGSAAAGNAGHGIVIFGHNNVLGASDYGERDIVSGNSGTGIYVSGGTGNQVLFSFVGTNFLGTAAVPNGGSGVMLDQASGSTLVQNVISGNAVDGVRIVGGGSNSIVTNNLIGLDAAGTAALPNGNHGVYIESSPSNVIGSIDNGNIISANAFAGVYITGAASAGNLVRGNFIGTRLSGTEPQGNVGPGVAIVSAGANKLGEAALGAGNVISGNGGPGVLISGGGGNEVLSNTIGTNPTGSAAMANGDHGVLVQESPNNTIGRDSTTASGNMISGNGGNGVFVTGSSTGTIVAGNTIGARRDGLAAIPNAGHGVALSGVSSATIGGDVSGEDNEIAGNALNGIYISGGSSNTILVNEIGIDGTGMVAVPNGLAGIVIENAGGGTSVQSSLVSGNTGNGIRLIGGSGTLLIADLVGTNVLGTAAVPNGGDGISIESSGGNTIGQPVSGQGNVVSGNGGSGISITGGLSTGNVIRNTVIGLNLSADSALPNAGHGIYIQGAGGNTIGGSTLTAGNRIAGNAGAGVAALSGSSNRIRLNLVHSNGRQGIDLDRDGALPLDGVTFNDRDDADTGANALQNHPVLTAATDDTVDGVIRGAPGTAYTVDLFSSAACDSVGFGEGATFRGTTTVTTNAGGLATFLMGFPAASPGTAFAATATAEIAGNTSEFSQCIVVDRVPVETLALFRPDQGWIALIASPNDSPPLEAYTTYVSGAPVQGQWVMGDWNGDGIDTPAVYGNNGAFHYTDDLGQTSNWTGIWFGLLDKPPVAGRFDAAVDHDCLGVVDSTPWPPYGTAFAMYFTCDLTSGPDPPKEVQWMGAPLPDSSGFTGTHQFAAGDFDQDGVDTMATRRGPHIAWTNTPPTTLVAPFDQAQYIGAPGAGYGQLTTGDWEGDRVDSFGLFYTDGSFYWRGDLAWNSATYTLQRVGQPIGPGATAHSWRPGGRAGNP